MTECWQGGGAERAQNHSSTVKLLAFISTHANKLEVNICLFTPCSLQKQEACRHPNNCCAPLKQ